MTPTRRWTLVATILASSMTFIDGTVVNVALPALQAGLHATMTDVQWVIEAYALLLGALILVGGSLGDQLGRKRVFLCGVAVFTIASVACGFATTPGMLIAGRALQGTGAAFLVPGSLAIISDAFEEAERGRAIGTWSGFSSITTAIGPVTGGWLVEHVSWRAVFFLNVPLAAVVLMLSLRFMNESRDPSRTSRIDWAGAALAVVGLGGVVLGLLEWPPLGGGHPVVLGAIGFGVLLSRDARDRRAPRGEPDASAWPVQLAHVHPRQRAHPASVCGAEPRDVPRAAQSDPDPALHRDRRGRGACCHFRSSCSCCRDGRVVWWRVWAAACR